MLNAFRHQRMDHNRGCRSRSGQWICAQRLSASTNGSHPASRNRISQSSCAQRLSASTNGSPLSWGDNCAVGGVLNAFRHQRMDHGIRIVLFFDCYWCSTPFGINEWITVSVYRALQKRFNVLNAFRHQRMDHGLVVYDKATGNMIVLNAFRHQRMDHFRLCIA